MEEEEAAAAAGASLRDVKADSGPALCHLSLGRPSTHPSSPMAAWSREAVLTLYRALLRQGRGLRYTDRDFYLAFIRREFRKNRGLQQLEDKERQLEKGQAFLQSKLGGLV